MRFVLLTKVNSNRFLYEVEYLMRRRGVCVQNVKVSTSSKGRATLEQGRSNERRPSPSQSNSSRASKGSKAARASKDDPAEVIAVSGCARGGAGARKAFPRQLIGQRGIWCNYRERSQI